MAWPQTGPATSISRLTVSARSRSTAWSVAGRRRGRRWTCRSARPASSSVRNYRGSGSFSLPCAACRRPEAHAFGLTCFLTVSSLTKSLHLPGSPRPIETSCTTAFSVVRGLPTQTERSVDRYGGRRLDCVCARAAVRVAALSSGLVATADHPMRAMMPSSIQRASKAVMACAASSGVRSVKASQAITKGAPAIRRRSTSAARASSGA